ncbi:MAG: hypothetical protein WC551_12955 [Patescibacteria group bacterium]
MRKIEFHHRLPPPGFDDIQAEMTVSGIAQEEALVKLLKMRDAEIRAEHEDPLRYGYEPDIWKVGDALLDWPWCYDQRFLKRLKDRLNIGWREFCGEMRKLLGYLNPASMLLILGGNRSGKSEYSAKRGIMVMVELPYSRIRPMHMSESRSRQDQQPLYWKYMPPEWRVQSATEVEYIKWKQKVGFADNSFVTPNGADCAFLNYNQDRDTALQGQDSNYMAPDELVPADWVDYIAMRLVTRSGKGVFCFTPVNGYTPTVKAFCDSAKIARTITAYLLPRDRKSINEPAALNLTDQEYEGVWKAHHDRRLALAPQSRPEDVISWLEHPEQVKNPRYEQAPRVLKCVDPKKAVIYFNPADNQYGNPKGVVENMRKKDRVFIRQLFYGEAERTVSVMIPKFRRKIHLIKARDIPKDGTNYFFMDPAGDRNPFMSWFRICGANIYLYREWPGNYYVPGVGIPGPWAIPSGKNDGINDGARGEGQESWGWGNLRLKYEIARLEGWLDYVKWQEENGDQETMPGEDELAEWDERNGVAEVGKYKEIIEERFIDSRAASAPRVENDRPVTLQTEFDDINLYFNLTPGADITDGVSKINTAMDYELDEAGNFINPPHFFICDECENTIFAIENWMNKDGQKGATKDPIDNIRYCVTAGLEDTGRHPYTVRGGFSYAPQRTGRSVDRARKGPRRLPPARVKFG